MKKGIVDEMTLPDGTIRGYYAEVAAWLNGLSRVDLMRNQKEAEAIFRRSGITFAIYGGLESNRAADPFRYHPAAVRGGRWRRLSAGIEQRVRALNAFIHDIYHRQEILRAGRIPAPLVLQNEAFVPEMMGVNPPRNVYAPYHRHRYRAGRATTSSTFSRTICRTPSGVSYMLEDREAMMYLSRSCSPEHRVAPIEQLSGAACEDAGSRSLRRPATDEPTLAVLTPGIHNSAFFEHSFLADEMGVELCEGSDLFVEDG